MCSMVRVLQMLLANAFQFVVQGPAEPAGGRQPTCTHARAGIATRYNAAQKAHHGAPCTSGRCRTCSTARLASARHMALQPSTRGANTLRTALRRDACTPVATRGRRPSLTKTPYLLGEFRDVPAAPFGIHAITREARLWLTTHKRAPLFTECVTPYSVPFKGKRFIGDAVR
jgi:hypothetical protein